MCHGWDPAWPYTVSCHDWPLAGSGGRATPGVLEVDSHPFCRCGRLSWSLWYGCCPPAHRTGSVSILCPSETICHHGKSKNFVSRQTWRCLVDRAQGTDLQRCVFHHTSEPSSAMGVAAPWVWQCHTSRRHHQRGPVPRPCPVPLLVQAQAPQPSSAMAPWSSAHRSAANGEPSLQASPRPIGQQGWAGPPACTKCK